MATYNFSSLPASKTFTSFATTGSLDIINFNVDGILASSAVFSSDAAGNAVLTIANKTLTFSGVPLSALVTGNFLFSNGSKIQLGNSTDNTFSASGFGDYIDGNGGVDTVSFTQSVSEVNVSLVGSALQNTLGSGNMTLRGIENLTGSAFDDVLTGNAGDNSLNGGKGADVLSGGLGNDSYVVDDAFDQVIEGVNGGNDTVFSAISYTLSDNIENLVLTGSSVRAVGNAGVNVITGNSTSNMINGGSGADTLFGMGGNDMYYVDNSKDVVNETVSGSSGTDLVKTVVNYTLSANVENLQLLGSGSLSGTGNSGDNIIYAGYGNNAINGISGNDTVSYQYGAAGGVAVDLSKPTAQNTGGSGSDTLVNVDNVSGSRFSDRLTGDANANVLDGGLGNDVLIGGNGNDGLIGGYGNDTYVVSNINGYKIVEQGGQGVDTIQSSVTFNLGASSDYSNIENLTLTGTADLGGAGNSLNNTIIGNTGANNLNGGSGNDYLDGKTGADALSGGSGNDTFVVDNSGDTVFENAGEGTDLVLASADYTLPINVEGLTLQGAANINGTGNGSSNTLIGNTGNNTLIGGAGNDSLIGDVGNDLLDGGSGSDSMTGGIGNDSYYVDTSSDTVNENANEGTDTVFSSVSYKIVNKNVENLTLTGNGNTDGTGTDNANVLTGNGGKNHLLGNDGADTLVGGDGNDVLDGGKDVDIMNGGNGDDSYYVDNTDKVNESANAGYDTINTSVTFTLGNNVEELVLTGSTQINGNGGGGDNTLRGNSASNILSGGNGNDFLDGGAGKDKLIGGAGNDTFSFSLTNDSKPSAPDSVADFTKGQDVIDLSRLHVAAVHPSLLTKGDGFTGTAGEVQYTSSGLNGSDTAVNFDINGDAKAEFSVVLTGFTANLSVSDFIL